MTMLGPVRITQFYTEGPMEGQVGGFLDIGFWTIGRTEKLRDVENQDDEVYTYRWEVTVYQRDGHTDVYDGEVTHRYGDGWVKLMALVFEEADAAEKREDRKPAGTT